MSGLCAFLGENSSIQLEEVHLRPAPAATTSVDESLFETNEQEKQDEEDNLVEAEKDAVAANTDSGVFRETSRTDVMSLRDKYCMTLETGFPIPSKYSDVDRQTQTSVESLRQRIDDD